MISREQMDKENKKDSHKKSKKFAYSFGFINDLAVLKDSGEHKRIFRKTFPAELELKKKNDINTKVLF